MQQSIAIICGGGPAPGINNVISTTARVFLKNNYRVIGVHEGFKGLLNPNARLVDIDFEFADRIFSQGGSAIKMSRYKPKDDEFRAAFFQENNVKLLVSIGGDDTASTAARLSDFLQTKDLDVKSIHVPKTIDNDLPLPEGVPTFGYQTAKETGVVLSNTVYEDARTSQNWFVMCAMGREAGHLAFGIGAACHFPMIVIPEIFNKTKITIDKIVRLVISSMIKRRLMGIHYGVAMISEGVFHFIEKEDLDSTGIQFEYDAHGHPELNQVSKAHIFNQLVMRKINELGLNQRCRPVELGYAMRCARPIGFDLTYTSQLGRGVFTLFEKGHSGCMVTQSPEGEVIPLFLNDVRDANGKIMPRLVDIHSHKVRTVYDMLHYLNIEDVEAARQYLPKPEEYVFENVLEW